MQSREDAKAWVRDDECRCDGCGESFDELFLTDVGQLCARCLRVMVQSRL